MPRLGIQHLGYRSVVGGVARMCLDAQGEERRQAKAGDPGASGTTEWVQAERRHEEFLVSSTPCELFTVQRAKGLTE
ncbi:hypothetical protein L682_02755 [Aquipseudomonas alcaligenes OT 69]|nr:hypothetical protein L682_02755 [Pseudomonas alcaligenes OT 69]